MAFEEYGFEREPFLPELQVPMRGREEEWEKITVFLNESLAGSRIRGFLILSDYGYGKTYMLNKIREEMDNPQSSINYSAVTIRVSIKLGRTEPEKSISYEYITKIFFSIGIEKWIQISKKIRKNKMKEFTKNFQLVITGLKSNNDVAFDWLSGETLTSSERTSLGVKTKFHPRQATTIFMDFLHAMKMAGYLNLLILIDEFEYAVNVYSEAKLTALFHTFKDIYDDFNEQGGHDYYAKHIQMIAMTPRGWTVVTDLEAKYKRGVGGGGITPWLDRMRFERDQVTLGPLDNKSSKEILTDRINRVRLRYKKLPYETFPFIEPSFFDVMIQIAKGKPRDLLDFSEIVLEEAIRKKKREINGDIVLSIMNEYGLIKDINH